MNNDCLDDKIKNILESGKKCRYNSLIVGPTGPTGPAGPATITVGATTTGDAGTNASVTNVGTNENVILNFSIPRGATGAEGPQGEQGEQGPPGTSSLNTYGRKYNNSNNGISLEINVPQNISLSEAGPTNNMTTGTENALTIVDDGIYLINYYFSGSSTNAGTITVDVKQNATAIGSTSISKAVTASTNTDFVGSTINTLVAGDQIGLDIKSSVATTVTPNTGNNAYLNIIRIA